MSQTTIAPYTIQLLDKQFDELTIEEWELLKNHEFSGINSETQDFVEKFMDNLEVEEEDDFDFGAIYFLRYEGRLIGSFYKKLFEDEWVAQPERNNSTYYCPNGDDAKYFIALAWIENESL